MDERLKKQLRFTLEIDKEKNILRQTHLSGHGRRENDAEHAWHMALMSYLLREYANEEVDIAKVMLMCLIHDIVEIDAGDTYAYDTEGLATQKEREDAAKERIYSLLPEDQKRELTVLFDEFEACETPDAKYAHAMDNLQPLLLNDSNGGGDWRQHAVTSSQVYGRQGKTRMGSETLYRVTDEIIRKNIASGNIRDDFPKSDTQAFTPVPDKTAPDTRAIQAPDKEASTARAFPVADKESPAARAIPATVKEAPDARTIPAPDTEESTAQAFTDLVGTIRRLRAPDGCPWDRVQTHESLKAACIEEAAEVVSGINILSKTGKSDSLQEELGDLLLQVLMHALIAEEEGLFTLADVIRTIDKKMIRRHPHVFHDDAGQLKNDSAECGQAKGLADWKQIKALEKQGREWEEPYLFAAFTEAESLIDVARRRKLENR